MMNNHLELWRCPVEWCTVWKESVGECLDHLRSKHNGAQFFAVGSLGKKFPRGLFPVIAGMRHFDGMYPEWRSMSIYNYPLPHPALWGGVLRQLIRFVYRAMTIAQMKQLHITILSEPVPSKCFPVVPLAQRAVLPHRVSFARDVSIIDSSPLLCSLVEEPESALVPLDTDMDTTEWEDIQIATPTYVLFPGSDPFEDLIDISPPGFPYLPAPPGFVPIVRPGEIPDPVEPPSLFADSPEIPGWFQTEQPAPARDLIGFQLSLSPISSVPSGDSVERPSSSSLVASDDSDGDVRLLTSSLSLPSFGSMPWVSVSSDISFYSAVGSPIGLTRDQFLSELPLSDVGAFGRGCAFRNTTHKSSDFAQPSGKYGLPLHNPPFLEWIGAPESAPLLDKGPSAWMHSLSRKQAIEAARQPHRVVCLMTSNLNILDQYVLCLQSTAATILELSVGTRSFPSAAVAAEAPVPRVRQASVHIEAMGLWRPSLDPVGWT